MRCFTVDRISWPLDPMVSRSFARSPDDVKDDLRRTGPFFFLSVQDKNWRLFFPLESFGHEFLEEFRKVKIYKEGYRGEDPLCLLALCILGGILWRDGILMIDRRWFS